MVMNNAYVNETDAHAVCCWDAPDLESVIDLFSKAGVSTKSVEEVIEFAA